MIKNNLKRRIISKLEVKGPNLIKSCQFDGLRSLGLAENFSKKYFKEGIDEIIYQDIVASLYGFEPKYDEIKRISDQIFVPFTVAGGLKNLEQIKKVFASGADKVAINSAAVKNPKLIEESAKEFGSQSVVSSIDIYSYENMAQNTKVREVWINNGKEKTELNLMEWINRVYNLGAGEILITLIDSDGTGKGIDINLVNKISENSKVPVIISGGIGSINDVSNLFLNTNIDAVSISSIFHYFYLKTFDTNPFKKFNKLRMGKNIDIGNYDFVNNGYGDHKYLFVDPISIPNLKKKLKLDNVDVRI
tara:strand:+ start:1 stop:915 length:915 start_codon:yes stop_codon:yes gene_type:complete